MINICVQECCTRLWRYLQKNKTNSHVDHLTIGSTFRHSAKPWPVNTRHNQRSVVVESSAEIPAKPRPVQGIGDRDTSQQFTGMVEQSCRNVLKRANGLADL